MTSPPRVLTTAEMPTALLERVRHLMDEAFAGDFSDDDWDHLLGGWHAVVVEDGVPVSHAAVVPRTLRVGERPLRTGYVEGVGTAPGRMGGGLGSATMTALDAVIRQHFAFGALGTGRYGFYERLGWERWRGRTWVHDSDGPVRTPEDDNAIMVLRFGPSADIDLNADLSCEARAGDDW